MNRFLLSLLLLTVTGCSSLSAPAPQVFSVPPPTVYGNDFLGLGNPNFKAQTVINAIENNSAIGVFDSVWPGSFGDPYAKVRQILQSGKVKILRVQIWYSYQHSPCPLNVLKRALPRWEKLALEFPAVTVYISPSTEYNNTTTTALIREWIKAIQFGAPHTLPVLSPGDGPVINGPLVERHGDRVQNALAVSTDGNSIFDANAAKLLSDNSNAVYLLGWGLRYNLAEAGNTLPPSARVAAPSVQYIRSINALFKPKTGGNLHRPQLYKTHAEDKYDPRDPLRDDPRANKPLFILQERVPFIQILDSNNTVLGKFPYYSTYLDQGFRYYSGSPYGMGLYGYQIGEIAKANTGSDVIKVKAGNHVYVVGSAAFRTPYYQD